MVEKKASGKASKKGFKGASKKGYNRAKSWDK
jgi:hypothetical protein